MNMSFKITDQFVVTDKTPLLPKRDGRHSRENFATTSQNLSLFCEIPTICDQIRRFSTRQKLKSVDSKNKEAQEKYQLAKNAFSANDKKKAWSLLFEAQEKATEGTNIVLGLSTDERVLSQEKRKNAVSEALRIEMAIETLAAQVEKREVLPLPQLKEAKDEALRGFLCLKEQQKLESMKTKSDDAYSAYQLAKAAFDAVRKEEAVSQLSVAQKEAIPLIALALSLSTDEQVISEYDRIKGIERACTIMTTLEDFEREIAGQEKLKRKIPTTANIEAELKMYLKNLRSS
jgi:hypothetical protein